MQQIGSWSILNRKAGAYLIDVVGILAGWKRHSLRLEALEALFFGAGSVGGVVLWGWKRWRRCSLGLEALEALFLRAGSAEETSPGQSEAPPWVTSKRKTVHPARVLGEVGTTDCP